MKKCKIHLLLDNIRSAFNVGSIFRTADALNCVEIYICGITPYPDNPRVINTALGAEKSVPFEIFDSTVEAVELLQMEGIPVYALEQAEKSKDFSKIEYPDELGIVVGHEREGVTDEVLEQVDKVIEIPMFGEKNSLNVGVAAAVLMYRIVFGN
jgi:tRNA G18 (ribose-2'-O)-methylase SpoU